LVGPGAAQWWMWSRVSPGCVGSPGS
jgi:hypothetical protein